jgi:hypothetical protein
VIEPVFALTAAPSPTSMISPDSGIFEIDVTVRYTDGPASNQCPVTSTFTNLDGAGTAVTDRFSATFTAQTSGATGFCILQGDILQVEYTDPTDASGDVNTVTDSATFDLRNGVCTTLADCTTSTLAGTQLKCSEKFWYRG